MTPAPSRSPRWGTHWRQRLRLTPLYWALRAGDAIAGRAKPRALPSLPPWSPGLTVLVPERDAPELLASALRALYTATAQVREPVQIVVIASDAPPARYDPLRERWPGIEWLHSTGPLRFLEAIERGMSLARHDWVYLLNNDMRLESGALAHVLAAREDDVFAIGSQILQRSADGRREESGFTDWYVDHGGVHLYHAPAHDGLGVRAHLVASGGAALFRRDLLRRYLRASHAYDPFYWEDAEWSVRAGREGWRVLFCAASRAHHAHRSTTSRLFADYELERIVERNRWLFDARHGASGRAPAWSMEQLCDLPYATQRELAHWRQAFGVLRQRARPRAVLPPPPVLSGFCSRTVALPCTSHSYRLGCADDRATGRPRVVIATPFAVFPPRHGGARRTAALAHALKSRFDVVLVTDEAGVHDARSFAGFDGLHAVHLAERRETGSTHAAMLSERMQTHCHDGMVQALDVAIARHAPGIVHVEHAELAPLVRARRPGERWVLGLHDAVTSGDFASETAAARFASDVLERYDALTVCCDEDGRLVRHRRVVCVPNGSSVSLDRYVPSPSKMLLFVGPFRYAPNLAGLLAFLRLAWPAIRLSVPEARLTVLGGDESRRELARHADLAAPGVAVLGHRDDVPALLRDAALTINPLTGIRGSAVKLVESLSAGRICVSTAEGARGFAGAGSRALVTVDSVAAMAAPIVSLLDDAARRHELERPDPATLAQYQWSACAARQATLYDALLAEREAATA